MDAILIAGPTASGKSALAMDLAAQHGGIVVNADSMQVYDALPVLTARPTARDMAEVPHALYGHVDAATSYSTGAWYRDAGKALASARASGRLPVVVGGTGLYFRALLGGLADMPTVPSDVRARWRRRLTEEGAERLYAELAIRDSEGAATLAPADGQRIVRALEILDATGQPLRRYQQRAGRALVDAGAARKILLLPERSDLYARIRRRVEAMLAGGAMEEVRSLGARNLDPALPAMKAIGVRELQAALAGETTIDAAAMAIAAASRRYAKRQTTWFRNQLSDGWERRETYPE